MMYKYKMLLWLRTVPSTISTIIGTPGKDVWTG